MGLIHQPESLQKLAWVLVGALASFNIPFGSGQLVTMETSYGQVTGSLLPGGTDEADVQVFYGIPFAKPPVGKLRFKEPVPPDSWSGSRDATQLPNSCWQALDTTFGNFRGSDMWNPNTNRSEDCLYLNVWVPNSPSQGKAILVWIFGGGFWAGTTTLDVYNAAKMAARHNVIVVSIAYRLGVFGFLYSADVSAPGNMGMLDQVMALEWIQRNAAYMDGDAQKVTLFGESAGAASVAYHMLSPLSKHLFNNGIMLSSTSLVNWGVQSHQTALQRMEKLADSVECSDSRSRSHQVACLRNVPAPTLSDRQWNVVSGLYFDAPFALVVDHHFLLEHPFDSVNAGMMKQADLIAGVVKNEGIYWLLYGFPDVFQRQEGVTVNRSQFLHVTGGILQQFNMAAKEYRKHHQPKAEVEMEVDGDRETAESEAKLTQLIKDLAVVEYYDGVSPARRMSYMNTLDAMSGDILFKCAVRDYCSAVKKSQKGNVYQYSFEHRLSSNPWPQWFGVAHGYEVEVVLGLPFLRPNDYTDDERALSDRVMAYFTNFSKTGNPNNAGTKTWKQYTLEDQSYHILDINDSGGHSLRYSECRFWERVVPLLRGSSEGGKYQEGEKSQKGGKGRKDRKGRKDGKDRKCGKGHKNGKRCDNN